MHCASYTYSNTMTTYASGHIVLPGGRGHLQSAMYRTCAPSPNSNNLALFRSSDGYQYDFVSYMATSPDVPFSSEGPNEHDIALLPNGSILCVFRTGAGDGRGNYMPFYSKLSEDEGKTWSKPKPLIDTDGHYMGCARPHLLQVRVRVRVRVRV